MEQLKQSQEIINLGKKIVSEFSREGGYNTSVQWMGHYLAELMHRSENATSNEERVLAEKECASQILELWKQRPYLPERIAPMSKLSHTIAILNSLKSEKLRGLHFTDYIERDGNSALGHYITQMRKSSQKIVDLCVKQSVNENDLKSETEWLEHLSFLTAEERQVIQGIQTNFSPGISSEAGNDKKMGTKNPGELNAPVLLLIKELKQQHALQLGYLEDLQKKLLLQKTKKAEE